MRWSRRACAAAAALCVALAVPASAQQQTNWNERGNAAVERGKLAEAVVDYTRATEQIPLDPVPWFNRANTYAKLGKTTEALSDVQHAIALHPYLDEGYALIARLRKDLGQFDVALASIDHALVLKSGVVPYHLERADLLRLLHRATEAAAEFEDALRRDPRSAIGLHGLAEIRLEQHRDRDALALLERYVTVAPDDPDVNVVAAALLTKANRAEDALAWIAAHPSSDPRMVDYKVRALLMLGRTGAAAAALPASAQGEPAYRASLRGEIAFHAGRCREAADAFHVAASAPQTDAPPGAAALAWRNAGAASACAKDYATALSALTRAIDLNPADPLARRYRAGAHRAFGDFTAAIADARAALERGGPDADLLMLLGIDEYVAGLEAAGIRDYQQGCALLDAAHVEKRTLCAQQLAKMKSGGAK